MRKILLSLILVLTSANFSLAQENNSGGHARISVQGKIIRENNFYDIVSKNNAFTDGELFIRLVPDAGLKPKLDAALEPLVGRIVTVKGTLDYMTGRIEGPTVAIPIHDIAQILVTSK